jgi:hypothetical protein
VHQLGETLIKKRAAKLQQYNPSWISSFEQRSLDDAEFDPIIAEVDFLNGKDENGIQ